VNRIQDTAGAGYVRVRHAPGVVKTGTWRAPGCAQIGIRQASSEDCDAIRVFLAGLSPRTRYLRFFTGAPPANAATLRRLAGDGENFDAVVATEAGAIIGHAMAADTTGPAGATVTEIGVAVTDTRQGRGVGSALTRALAQRARARGATALAMDVLAENRQVMVMIADHWPTAHYDHSGPYVTVCAGLGRAEEMASGQETPVR
jgi:GNAT superfamily N-acetyltransferase